MKVDDDVRTKEDIEDELLFLETEREYKLLTTDRERRDHRRWVTPLFQLNRRPIGKHFKDSEDKAT